MTNTPQVTWLGQAGFAIAGTSTKVVVDPYLSDLCERLYGLVRLISVPTTPTALAADAVLVSHWHEDHLDIDSAAEFARTGAVFVAPPSCIERLLELGIDETLLRPISTGETVCVGDATITAVPALHDVPEAATPDAVGYLIELDESRIYHSGDSEYTRGMLAARSRGPLDLALICMNGTGGNMNAWEAALLAAELAPRVAIPMHYNMWERSGYGPDATLDPELFLDIYGRLAPEATARIALVGEPFEVS